MIKKFGLLLLVLVIGAIFSTALMAQKTTPITKADVDLFLKLSAIADPMERATAMSQAGKPEELPDITTKQGLITALGAYLGNPQMTEDAIKAALPQLNVTEEEYAVILEQKDAVVEAAKAVMPQ
ncbi:MAG: hypothetical protein LBT62_00395 [Deltaproteobacteria bacterium]|jgi:hypothetical protein|nr:hypothetical protein [Deltaproteobacteria bacterium]